MSVLIPKGQRVMFLDQNGSSVWVGSVAELRSEAGGGPVVKMYVDDKTGKSWHCGYIVGRRWFTAYLPLRVEAD